MTELQQSKHEREVLVFSHELVEKQARMDLERAVTIRDCLLMGKSESGESWKQREYWTEEQEQQLLSKMHQLLLDL